MPAISVNNHWKECMGGLAFSLILHSVVLYALWKQPLPITPVKFTTMSVSIVVPPERQSTTKPQPSIFPKHIEKPKDNLMVSQAQSENPAVSVAPAPVATTQVEAAIQPLPALLPLEPVVISSELSLICPGWVEPAYPVLSRKMGETGLVVLRVEINESGKVASAKVERSSGYPRLDNAALETVLTWHCVPPRRNGKPTQAIAYQPFNFVLQGK
jgi:protein TonB